MSATLTELHRKTAKIMGRVIHGKETVFVENHGKRVATIIPEPEESDMKAFLTDLEDFGKLWREAGCRMPER